MKLNKPFAFLAALLAAMLLPSLAKADGISFTLSNAVQSVSNSGATLSFSGKVTNTSSVTQYFNADGYSFSLNPNQYTFDDAGFMANLFLLAPNESYTGELFTLALASSLTPGTYVGSYYLLGGASDLDQNLLGSATVQVNVTAPTTAATPEPSSLLLLSTGGLTLAGMMRRRFAAVR